MDRKTRIAFLTMKKDREGQGVRSASLEDISLVERLGKDKYEVSVNSKIHRADIVHCLYVLPKFYFALKRHHPSVMMVHFLPDTLDGSISMPHGFLGLYKRYVMKFYSQADELVTVNPIYVDKLVQLGFSREHATYIPNYVSPDEFKPLPIPQKVKVRREFKIPDEAFVALAVGQTQPRKGLFDFITVAEDNPDITFVWAGGFSFGHITADYDEIKKALKNPPPNVRFLGIIPRAKMNELYNAANVLFFPSYDELFPMTILEAANVNLPILVRDLPLYDPIVGDKVLKAHGNEEFSDTLKKLKGDPALLAECALHSSELAGEYTPEAVFSKWDRFYQRILVEYGKKHK